MYYVKFYTYSGMSIPFQENLEKREARDCVARIIRSRRRIKQPIVTLLKGKAWEFETPEDAFLIGDYDGTLHLQRETFECRECGYGHDEEFNSLNCCTED